MTYSTSPSQFWNRSLRRTWQRLGLVLAGTSTVVLQFGMMPGFAADPFRPSNPHSISATAESAFYAMFRDGNYVAAKNYLANASGSDVNEPMIHALSAALAYLDGDLDTLLSSAQQTQQAAAAMQSRDPLRGNLYAAVGIFLEGAHVLQTQGVARGTPRALAMLQRVFDHMSEAERINPEDPELSLLKGFMDLLLAVNLPFANPERAIERLATYGYPTYVSQRGIAIGYRDLGENEKALAAVEQALAAAPDNPDLMYLKAQILRRLGRNRESVTLFAQALEYDQQLPLGTVRQIVLEQCFAERRAADVCRSRADSYTP